jgi:hypothetical protein
MRPPFLSHLGYPIIIVFLFGSVLSLSAALEFEKTAIEIQAKPSQKAVTAIFRCRNTGKKAVTVTRIRTTCGCTTAAVSGDKTIQPGADAEIPVTMDLQVQSGRQEKGIVVETKRAPFRYDLSIAAVLPEYVKVSPRNLIWVRHQPDDRRVVMLTALVADVQLGAVTCPDPTFHCELEEANGGWRLAITPQAVERRRFAVATIPVTANGERYGIAIRLSIIDPPPAKKKTGFFGRLFGK